MDLQIVPEQTALERQLPLLRRDKGIVQGLARADHPSLHQEDVEVPVAVVVEESHTRREMFREIVLARHAIEVNERETGRLRLVREPLGGSLGLARRTRAARVAAAREHRESDE